VDNRENLFRVENAVTATASGDLTWERWPLDSAVALGFAGQRNPLGFALVRYLGNSPTSEATWGVVLVLAGQLNNKGVAGDSVKDIAWQAFDWWRDARCPACLGRGKEGNTYKPCPTCSGDGHRVMPSGPDPLLTAISCLVEAEQWMEGQLNARLKRGG